MIGDMKLAHYMSTSNNLRRNQSEAHVSTTKRLISQVLVTATVRNRLTHRGTIIGMSYFNRRVFYELHCHLHCTRTAKWISIFFGWIRYVLISCSRGSQWSVGWTVRLKLTVAKCIFSGRPQLSGVLWGLPAFFPENISICIGVSLWVSRFRLFLGCCINVWSASRKRSCTTPYSAKLWYPSFSMAPLPHRLLPPMYVYTVFNADNSGRADLCVPFPKMGA